MRRLLAPAVVAALVLHAPRVQAEPLDFDLSLLGAPSAAVWDLIAGDQAVTIDSTQAANDAKKRFGVLSTDLALALTSAVLQPAVTTGFSGFEIGLEGAYVGVHPDPIGTAPIPGLGTSVDPWATNSMDPHELFVTAIHVRKALPFSFELGGRILYPSQTSYFAGQLEAKWAFNEGSERLPDVAVRVAHTQLFAQRDMNLGATDLDFIVSKRFGVNGVVALSPYLAARFTFVRASTDLIQFYPAGALPDDPGTPENEAVTSQAATQASFPALSSTVYRTTAGVRLKSAAVTLGLEVTYFGGGDYGKASPGAGDYPEFNVPSTWGGAFSAGFRF